MKKEIKKMEEKVISRDKINPRGRFFQGTVTKKFNDRVEITFERLCYLRKYERYEKRKTKLQARIDSSFEDLISVGDYIEIRECKPISKNIHFVVTKKIRSLNNESN